MFRDQQFFIPARCGISCAVADHSSGTRDIEALVNNLSPSHSVLSQWSFVELCMRPTGLDLRSCTAYSIFEDLNVGLV